MALRCAGMLAALLFTGEKSAAETPARVYTAYQIEAVYLYNFAEFVEWPAQSFPTPDSPLVIGILGKDPFGSTLDEVVKGEKVNGRALVVRRFARISEIDACNILFIARSESSRVGQICSALKNRQILTVSEISDFARRGGIIEMVEENERIRLRIALDRARAESLSISAKLLRAAEVVSSLVHRSLFALSNFAKAHSDHFTPPYDFSGPN